MMKKITILLCLAVAVAVAVGAREKTVTLKVVETSDVHGSFFPYDFINRRDVNGSLARAQTYIKELRSIYGKNVILLDNGDILQGQPVCYYSNYIATDKMNIVAKVTNAMGYDAQTMGNHDVETGHEVYDKWISETRCPILGANIIDRQTGKPYVEPYTIIERDGVRIAVIGMITPAIPNWLNEDLWSGLHFDEMTAAACKWVKRVRETEKADIVIGLFHSGREGGITTDDYEEDASLRVAKEVAGFDLVLFGHDHNTYVGEVTNVNGDRVVCLDPANAARNLAVATIDLKVKTRRGSKVKILSKKVSGELVDITKIDIDSEYMEMFKDDIAEVKAFTEQVIGTMENDLYSRDSFFGSSAFIDIIHDLQLEKTGADISFNAPLMFNARIKKGNIRVSDLFNLYKFENRIYVLRMTGEEIRKHLEMSYDLWVNTMKSPDDHIMMLDTRTVNDNQRTGFKNMTFNFDSAVGIDYEVDVTKPDGEKVNILGMSNGEKFEKDKWYKIVMNSYRGNGGGELLTKGVGLSKEEIEKRIIWKSERDQRYYLMEKIKQVGTMNPVAHNNWRFVPEEWTKPAIERDRKLLFNR